MPLMVLRVQKISRNDFGAWKQRKTFRRWLKQ
jgi:hypothetical protein